MLNREEILRLIKEKKLIENYVDLEKQLTPNGFDLSVRSVYEYGGPGVVDFDNSAREIPEAKEVRCENNEWFLGPGSYKIRTNERVNLPLDLIGMAFTRSTLLRMGAYIINGVWDAGFSGTSEFILCVRNPHGIKLRKNARVNQLIFKRINKVDKGYSGVYQGK